MSTSKNRKNQTKIPQNNCLYKILFTNIEPLGYQIIDYCIRVELLGQSWESPLIKGGEIASLRKSITKLQKQRSPRFSQENPQKYCQWCIELKGPQVLKGTIKFIEMRQEKERPKGKSDFQITLQGSYELYMHDYTQKTPINSPKANFSARQSQNLSKNQEKGKRIAYVQYEVEKNFIREQKDKGSKVQTNTKSEVKQQDIHSITKEVESQNQPFNFLISEQNSEAASMIKGINKNGVQNSEVSHTESQAEESMVNELGHLQSEMEKYLQERKDENLMFSRFLEEESAFIEEAVGQNGKSKASNQTSREKLKKGEIKNNFKFRGRRTCFSVNPEGIYQDTQNVSSLSPIPQQQSPKKDIHGLQSSQESAKKFNEASSHFKLSTSLQPQPHQRKEQIIKQIISISRFTIDSKIKPTAFWVCIKNTNTQNWRNVVQMMNTNGHQYAWPAQIRIEQNRLGQEVRVKVRGSDGQILEGNIEPNGEGEQTYLYQVNNKEWQQKATALLRYRVKPIKMVETKYMDYIQIPEIVHAPEKHCTINHQIEEQQDNEQVHSNQQGYSGLINLCLRSKTQSYTFPTQEEQHLAQQKEKQLHQKVSIIKSMFSHPLNKLSLSHINHKYKLTNGLSKKVNQQGCKNTETFIPLQSISHQQQSNSHKQSQYLPQIITNRRKYTEESDIQLNKEERWLNLKDSDRQSEIAFARSSVGVSQPATPKISCLSPQAQKVNVINMNSIVEEQPSILNIDNSNGVIENLNKDQRFYRKKGYKNDSSHNTFSLQKTPRKQYNKVEQILIKDQIDKLNLTNAANIERLRDLLGQLMLQDCQNEKSLKSSNQNKIKQQVKDQLIGQVSKIQQLNQLSQYQPAQSNCNEKRQEVTKPVKIQVDKPARIEVAINTSYESKRKRLMVIPNTLSRIIVPQKLFKIIGEASEILNNSQSSSKDKIYIPIKPNEQFIDSSRMRIRQSSKSNRLDQIILPSLTTNNKDEICHRQKVNFLDSLAFADIKTLKNEPYQRFRSDNSERYHSPIIRKKVKKLKTIDSQGSLLSIQLINVILRENNPLTGKHLTLQVQGDTDFRTETLACNNRLLWKGQRYNFKLHHTVQEYSQYKITTPLIIKLYEETSGQILVMGNIVKPISSLIESGPQYHGVLVNFQMQVIGEIIIGYKIFPYSDWNESQTKFSKKKYHSVVMDQPIKGLSILSKKINSRYSQILPPKKRSVTLGALRKGGLESKQKKFSIEIDEYDQQRNKSSHRKSCHSKNSKRKHNRKQTSCQKYEQLISDPAFMRNLLQIKQRCRHFRNPNDIKYEDQDVQRKAIRSYKNKYKSKKAEHSIEIQQAIGVKSNSPEIEMLKKKKRFITQQY